MYSAIIPYACTVNHDGRLYTIEVPDLDVAKCRLCGEIAFDDFASDQITDALRRQIHLLSPEQIRRSLKALGLRQKELAARLGVAEATMSRWCTGSLIQSRAMDNLMRVYFGIPAARAALVGPEQDPSFGATVGM
jgi:DNA-binding transcriptional regulator YiaG